MVERFDVRDQFWLINGSNTLYAYKREGNVPPLVSNFEAGKYGINGRGKLLSDVVPSFTRASAATYVNSSGALATAAVDQIRIDYDPATGARLGMLIEPAATNLVVAPAAPATQTITVADLTEYTLHFTGTGSITLTGASTSGPLVGTGAGEANRVSLTFTTAGTGLTLTMSGTVANVQLEIGNRATSFVDGTRAKDDPSILTSDFGYADGAAGTWIAEFTPRGGDDTYIFSVNDGTSSMRVGGLYRSVGKSRMISRNAGIWEVALNPVAVSGDVRQRVAYALDTNDAAASFNGAAVVVDTAVTIPTGITNLNYGAVNNATSQLNGWLHSLVYHDARLTNSELLRASTI